MPTVFTDRFWDDRENWSPPGVGVVPRSTKPYFGPVPSGEGLQLVGTPDEWVNGLDLGKYLRGEYTNPNGCIPVVGGVVPIRFRQQQGMYINLRYRQPIGQVQGMQLGQVVYQLGQVQGMQLGQVRRTIGQVQGMQLGQARYQLGQVQGMQLGPVRRTIGQVQGMQLGPTPTVFGQVQGLRYRAETPTVFGQVQGLDLSS